MSTKAQAQADGEYLLSKLVGKGWKLRVWENLNWHFEVSNGALTVHGGATGIFGGRGQYWCLLSSDPKNLPGAWHTPWTDTRRFDDPNDAVEYQIHVARKYVDSLDAIVLGLEERFLKEYMRTKSAIRA